MKNNLKKLDIMEPNGNLKEKIIFQIEVEIEKRKERQILFSFALSALSVFAFTSFLFLAGEELINSGFWQILKLIFTDTSIVFAHFSEYLYSLIETMPVFEFLLFLIPLFAFLLSLNYLIQRAGPPSRSLKGVTYGH